MTATSDGTALTGLWFDDTEHYPHLLPEGGEEQKTQECAGNILPVFEETDRWLDLYFAGEIPVFMPPIAMVGSDFQKEVWSILLTIPYGGTTSYGEIARKIAEQRGIKRMAAQAVGGAVGRNPICIIVPCHRVIGTDRSLTGYGGGMDRKIWLLNHEGITDYISTK